MRIDPMEIDNRNRLVTAYLKDYESVADKFDYHPFAIESQEQRLKDLSEMDHDRDSLVRVLTDMNKSWQAPSSTIENIHKLADRQTVAVVGGQQAGLMTGPLYSVHKVISILHYAKQAEENLRVPVVPVFWVAGEDHDFAEVNHLMQRTDNRMKKIQTAQRVERKYPVSDVQLDKAVTKEWLDRVFAELEETAFTKDIHRELEAMIEDATSYVDFFVKVIYRLFNEEGIVLIDSNHPELREMESGHFVRMIENNENIARGVYASCHESALQGFPVALDSELNDAHLFYHLDGERILLVRDEEGKYIGKQHEVAFTREELLDIARNEPEKLSNNVVTRPIMQELVFPTLAFIGGPGEISYWSVLKASFGVMNLKMPPIVPRLSFTWIDRKTVKYASEFQLSIKEIILNGTGYHKSAWLMSQNYPPLEQSIDQVKLELERIHEPLRKKAGTIRDDLGALAEKNLFHLFREVEFLGQRMAHAMEEKHERELKKFDHLSVHLHPEGGLQERMWGVLPFINTYGWGIFQEVVKHRLSSEASHYGVYL
ncbi:bacillithiol biosynthesis cysteine-adding enzyme BshC [Thalassobacillus hwangdonensis]|uniref:Putative cysteine ligase BshC n=1 Tax=Thalassobacillus hwangdonensis TaxID=546108 RepID=A0ABW3KY75_9BACI